MPAYSNPGPDEDMYSDAEGTPAEEARETPEEESEEGKGPVATIPKSLLAGKDFQPGEEVVFKIVSIQDDSVVIEYAPGGEGYEEKGEGEGEEMRGGPMMEGGDRYAEMME